MLFNLLAFKLSIIKLINTEARYFSYKGYDSDILQIFEANFEKKVKQHFANFIFRQNNFTNFRNKSNIFSNFASLIQDFTNYRSFQLAQRLFSSIF